MHVVDTKCSAEIFIFYFFLFFKNFPCVYNGYNRLLDWLAFLKAQLHNCLYGTAGISIFRFSCCYYYREKKKKKVLCCSNFVNNNKGFYLKDFGVQISLTIFCIPSAACPWLFIWKKKKQPFFPLCVCGLQSRANVREKKK